MTVTAKGRKIVAMTSVNSLPRPGNRKRAKPYATRVHDRTVPIVVMIAIAAVLKKIRGKLSCSHASEKLVGLGANVQAFCRSRQEPCHVMSPASGLAGSTNWLS